jgi:hypothetical protein
LQTNSEACLGDGTLLVAFECCAGPAHKIAAVRAAIVTAGAQLFLLPPERTRDGLWQRIGALLDRFTPDECANYFRAAGYADPI